MSDQEQVIRIAGKLQHLLRSYEILQTENQKLKAEVGELRTKQASNAVKIAELEQSVAVLRTLTGNLDEQDKKALEKQLNLYIREIDRCIAMLGE